MCPHSSVSINHWFMFVKFVVALLMRGHVTLGGQFVSKPPSTPARFRLLCQAKAVCAHLLKQEQFACSALAHSTHRQQAAFVKIAICTWKSVSPVWNHGWGGWHCWFHANRGCCMTWLTWWVHINKKVLVFATITKCQWYLWFFRTLGSRAV